MLARADFAPGRALAAVLLAGAAVALYWSALRHPLVFDDFHLSRNMLGTYYAHATDRFGMPRWLSDASFYWVHLASGGDLLWQRLANVLLHAATAVVLYGFLARLFAAVLDEQRESRRLAFFGALWFLAHPVAVYGVAYVIQRSSVLATFFCVLALWCVLEGLLRRSPAWYAAALAAYVLALFAKEHAAMLPAVAAALALLVRGPSAALLRRLGLALVAAALIGALVLARRRNLIGAAYEPFAADILGGAGPPIEGAYALSIVNQATLFFRYLATCLVPWPGWMSIDVRTPFPRQLFGWPQTAGLLAWLAFPVAALLLIRRGGRAGLAGFGLGYFWLMALTEYAAVRAQEPFVLYRSYLWLSGLPAILPAVLSPLPPRWRIAVAAVVIAALAAAAHERIGTFASPLRLWDDAVRQNAGSTAPYVERAYVNRGLAYLSDARLEAASADFERALELNPRYGDAYLGRGTLRLRGGRLREALEDLDRAVALDPTHPSPYHKRCVIKAGQGRMREALADCDKAAELDRNNYEVWINRGVVLRAVGRGDDAAASYERALELRPRNGSAHYNYGVLLLDRRRDGEALRHFQLACEVHLQDACDLLRK